MPFIKASRFLVLIIALHGTGVAVANEPIEAVDLFAAIDAGTIDVKFIPANAAKANVLVNNKTDHVLHVALPDAIAAVPVLAQFAANDFGRNGGQNGGQNGGASQGVGGGLNAGNGQGPGNGFGNGLGNGLGNGARGAGQANGFGMGFMRIPPGKTRKLTARTVCLEYGKPEPNPRIVYRMIPIQQFTDDARVADLCSCVGRGQMSQKAGQAAAWHLANGLSWEEIASINRLESRYLGQIKFFVASEIQNAKKWVDSLDQDSPGAPDNYALVK